MDKDEAFEGYRRASEEVNQELLDELGEEEYNARQHWINNPLISPLDKLHLFRTAILNARAVAWDEGFDVGEKDVYLHEEPDSQDHQCIQNPYRLEEPND